MEAMKSHEIPRDFQQIQKIKSSILHIDFPHKARVMDEKTKKLHLVTFSLFFSIKGIKIDQYGFCFCSSTRSSEK